jgi:hypothetical protein
MSVIIAEYQETRVSGDLSKTLSPTLSDFGHFDKVCDKVCDKVFIWHGFETGST